MNRLKPTNNHRISKTNLAKNIIFLHTLHKIIEPLLSENIEVIALKGMALLGREYSDLSHRRMGDIDLLVRKEELSKIDKIFSRLGAKNLNANKRNQDFIINRQYLFPFGKKEIIVELHYALFPEIRYKLDYTQIFSDAQPHPLTEFAQKGLKRLSPEYLLNHLALHRLRHYYTSNSKDLTDAINIIKYNQIDGHKLSRIACEWKIISVLFFFLHQVNEYYQVSNIKIGDEKFSQIKDWIELLKPSPVRRAIIFSLLDPRAENSLKFSCPFRLKQLLLSCLFSPDFSTAIKYPVLFIKSRL